MIPNSIIDLIKSRLTGEEVLKLIGYSKSNPRKNGGELRDVCPVHKGDGPDRNLTIAENGRWFCHSHECKGVDLIDLYKQGMNIDFKTAVYDLAAYTGVSVEESIYFSENQIKQKSAQPTLLNGEMKQAEKLAKSRKLATEAWDQAAEGNGHPYFERKGIEHPPGIRYGNDEKGNLSALVPYYDIRGSLQAVQFVNTIGKFFATGSTPNGAFFTLGSLQGSTIIYLCEGIATAISIWISENKAITTISCGSCNNIPKVVAAIKEKYPDLQIIICSDLNEAADNAAQKVIELNLSGLSFRKPSFVGVQSEEDKKDFNDLYQLAGAEVVKAQLREYKIRPSKIEIKSISELPVNYLTEKPSEKPQLLYWIDKKGIERAFLHKEIVAMLIAEGGAGKTHLLSLLAFCVATGIPFLTHFKIKKTGPVCFIVGENNDGDIHRLIWKMNKYLEKLLEENRVRTDGHKFDLIRERPLEELASRFYPFSVHGMKAFFIEKNGNTTSFYASLLDELKKKEPEEGWQLIICDPISRFAGLEAEKDNALATAFITCAERLSASLKGTPTILLAHHKSKAATGSNESGQTAGRGSSAFTDGARFQANLDVVDREEGISTFYLSKTNFTAPAPKCTIRRDFEGIPECYEWHEK